MFFGIHIDEVDDDDSSDIAQSELMHDLIRRHHIVLEGIFFLVVIEFLAAGVDIDGVQRLRLVDDQIPTLFESDGSTETGLHLSCDIKLVEDGLVAIVEFNDLSALGCNQFEILLHLLVDSFVVDLDAGEGR